MNLNTSDPMHTKHSGTAVRQRGNLAVKILCVFAAFCLWIYVMMVESPEHEQTFSHIVVELTNTDSLNESNLAIYNGYGTMIDVTLSGKKSVVSKLTESDIIATADMSTIKSGSGRYDCKVTVDVPAGCKLVGMSQESISVYLDRSVQISVDLTERRDNTKLPDGCYTGSIDFPVDKITVTGPSKYLDQIDKAVVPLDLTGVTRTTTISQKVHLEDAYGRIIENQYIQFYPQEVTVEIPVIKSVEVPLSVVFEHGFLHEGNTEISILPETVTVTGDPDIINAGNYLEPITVDEKTDFVDGTCENTVQLKAAEGLTLSSNAADITIVMSDEIISRRITVPSSNIVDTGARSGVEYTWDKSPVVISVIGTYDAIVSLQYEDIILELDMSPYSKTNTGTIRVRADVIFDTADSDKLLEIGTYDINVTFLN